MNESSSRHASQRGQSGGLRAWCERNPGWALDGDELIRTTTHADAEASAQFGSAILRRASDAGLIVAVHLDGKQLQIRLAPPEGGFTPALLAAARRLGMAVNLGATSHGPVVQG